MPHNRELSGLIRSTAQPLNHPLHPDGRAWDALLEQAAPAAFVLIGEASHGTHEFYAQRAAITRRLIAEHGFQAVAVEADWPDADQLNQYVRGRSPAASPEQALAGFQRFPIWMWRNREVADFIAWLRHYNQGRPAGAQAGFYGLDLYSLNRSRHAVIAYLDQVDPAAARRARQRYACFDHFGGDEQSYGYQAGLGLSRSCQDEVVQQLVDLQRRAFNYRHRDGWAAEDAFFSAERNAQVVANAEEYYRVMFHGRINTWNLRDQHMADTLRSLAGHLSRRHGPAGIVVWAHNSHLGDARATDRALEGEWNLGQLVRESGARAMLIGFTTYTGTVMAASHWGGAHQAQPVNRALPDSYEALFHSTGVPNFLLTFAGHKELAEGLRLERLERAIGVIYRPDTERLSHYFNARLSDQFDAVIHLDESHALTPLPHPMESGDEVPETYPTGI